MSREVLAAVKARELRGRAEILDAVGHHPYARFVAGMAHDLHGLTVSEPATATVWRCIGPFGPYAHGFGDAAALDPLFAHAARVGLLDDVRWVNLPRRVQVPPGWARREDWDYRWLTAPLRATPPVEKVSDASAIDALLDAAYPDGELRPGNPIVNDWYGIWVEGSLVACAADRSAASTEPDAVPTGVIGAVAVHPSHRGAGLGAAVTLGLAAILAERYEQVGLGVMATNETAARLYERVGFSGRHPITSISPA
jgi:ribosomal protein S18 acetylase RimI-like enzyme